MTQTQPITFTPCGGESWRNPFAMYRALRDHDPIHYVADNGEGQDYWVLSRFQDVFTAAVDAATFSSAQGLTIQYGEKEKIGIEAPLVMMDPPEHTALRKYVMPPLTHRHIHTIQPLVRNFVIDRIEKLRAEGSGDIVAELLKPLPSLVVAHFLGVPPQDREHFDRWTNAIVAANALGDVQKAQQAVIEMGLYVTKLMMKRRADATPGDDMISTLVHGRLDNNQPIAFAQVLGVAFTMVTGGNDTTTGLLGGALELLTAHPEQRAYLQADLPNRLPGAIEEFLRLTSPVQGLARTTTRDVVLDGKTIPKGKKVLLLYASANRDQREFGDDADECDLARRFTRQLAFSPGPHACIGAGAARLQARIVLEELLTRCPHFTVDAQAGRFAPGAYVRRYESLPFTVNGS